MSRSMKPLIESLPSSKSLKPCDLEAFTLVTGAEASAEEIEEYPEHGYGRHGEDNAEEARDLTAGDDGQEDQDRGYPQGLSLYPGRQEVAFYLLDHEEHEGR